MVAMNPKGSEAGWNSRLRNAGKNGYDKERSVKKERDEGDREG